MTPHEAYRLGTVHGIIIGLCILIGMGFAWVALLRIFPCA